MTEYIEPKYDDYGWTQWHWLVRYRENFKLGKNTQIGANTVIDAMYGVEIEDGVKIGFGCVIISNSTIDNKKGKIILKRNCKIGSNAVIMPGITIGENAVVGALSFVNKDVPKNTVYVGIPAKELKRR